MDPLLCFSNGFFAAVGAVIGVLAVGGALMMITVVTETLFSLFKPEPPVTQFHLHTEGEDSATDERNGNDRFPRN